MIADNRYVRPYRKDSETLMFVCNEVDAEFQAEMDKWAQAERRGREIDFDELLGPDLEFYDALEI